MQPQALAVTSKYLKSLAPARDYQPIRNREKSAWRVAATAEAGELMDVRICGRTEAQESISLLSRCRGAVLLTFKALTKTSFPVSEYGHDGHERICN